MSTQDERQIVPFPTVLQQVARGAVVVKLSEALANLAADVNQHQKPGQMTVTLKVEPTKGNETLTVSVTHTVRAPQATEASIFFTDDTGNLTRHDPRQAEAPLAAVGTARRGETA